MRLALAIASVVLATVLGVMPGHADKRVAPAVGNAIRDACGAVDFAPQAEANKTSRITKWRNTL